MEKVGDEAASKFINALIKSVQTLCHGYLDFQNGVEIIGHLNLSVDQGGSLDYILKEKVCKNAENSTLFISNSFHAEPKSEQEVPGKNSQTSSQVVQNKQSSDSVESGRVSSAISSISTALSGSNARERSRHSFTRDTDTHSHQNTAKRKASDDQGSEFRPSKVSSLSHENASSESPLHRSSSSPIDSKELLKNLRVPDADMSETMLPQTANVTSDTAADIGVNLAGSVLEPVDDHSNPDLPDRDDESDGDLEVTFIKEEYVEGERSACEFENSGQQFVGGPHQRASDVMPDPSLFPMGLHPGSASATYVPSAHDMGAAGQHFPGPSTSQPQPGPSGMRDALWNQGNHSIRQSMFTGVHTDSNQQIQNLNVWSANGRNMPVNPPLTSPIRNSTMPSDMFALTSKTEFNFGSNAHMSKDAAYADLLLRSKRIFKCPLCEYSNSRLYNLNRHMRCHTGDKFGCDLCDAEYNCKYKLQQHKVQKHCVQAEPNSLDSALSKELPCPLTYDQSRTVETFCSVQMKLEDKT